MALNQITVPGWAGRSAEADSWKEHSCAWAGASGGLWRRLSWREEYFRMGSCQVPAARRPPTAVGLFPFFFFDAEPGKAGPVAHLRQAWTLFNLRTLRFAAFWTLSRLEELSAFFFYNRYIAHRRHCTHKHVSACWCSRFIPSIKGLSYWRSEQSILIKDSLMKTYKDLIGHFYF